MLVCRPDHPPVPPPTRARRPRSPGALVLLAAVLSASTVACSRSTNPEPAAAFAPTTSTTAPPATTTAPTPEDEAAAAYLQAFDRLAVAAMDPGEDIEDFDEVMAGDVLRGARSTINRLRTHGIAVRYPDGTPPKPRIQRVKRKDARHVELTVCIVDRGVQLRTSDEKVLNDKVVSKLDRAIMESRGDGWRLLVDLRVWSSDGAEGCQR